MISVAASRKLSAPHEAEEAAAETATEVAQKLTKKRVVSARRPSYRDKLSGALIGSSRHFSRTALTLDKKEGASHGVETDGVLPHSSSSSHGGQLGSSLDEAPTTGHLSRLTARSHANLKKRLPPPPKVRQQARSLSNVGNSSHLSLTHLANRNSDRRCIDRALSSSSSSACLSSSDEESELSDASGVEAEETDLDFVSEQNFAEL
jgi:hypothetical protein